MKERPIGLFDILRSIGSWKIKSIKLADYIFGAGLALILPQRRIRSASIHPWKSILVIRPGGMGDAFFLLPFLKVLRRQFPNSQIDILCELRNYEVFVSQKNLAQRVYCYDLKGDLGEIFKNRYELIVDTEQWHYASGIVAYFLNPKMNVGFGTRPLRTKLFDKAVDYKSDQYEIENFQRLFSGILKSSSNIRTIDECFELDQESLNWAKAAISPQSVCLFLGSSIALRRLTHKQSVEIIRFILSQGFHVILLGGYDVAEAGDALEQELKNESVHNFVGKTSLLQSAALIKRSKIFVGPDSGIMHLSCAVGTPTIAIFGPGNLKKWTPQGKQHAVVSEYVKCSPCTHFGYTIPTCHGSYHCMRKINLSYIFEAIKKQER